jgi:hypothetical protein
MTQAENRNITNLSGRTRLVRSSNRRSFIGGSDARLIRADDDAPLLRIWREKRGEAEPEGLTGKPCERAVGKPFRSPALAAHGAFVAALSEYPSLSVYVAVILDDTAQNVPGGLDLPHVEAILFDLAADVTGAIQHAAEDMGWRIA